MSESRDNYLKPWIVMDSKESFKTPWFNIKKYSCETPTGQFIPEYYVHEAPDSVMCACITEDGFVILERQWRLSLQGISIDYPSGSAEPQDKSLEQAALRELKEETGFTVDSAKHLFTLVKDPGFSASKMHVFMATNARRIGDPTDKNELVVIDLLSPKEVLEAVSGGQISCALCVATTLRLAQLLNWK